MVVNNCRLLLPPNVAAPVTLTMRQTPELHTQLSFNSRHNMDGLTISVISTAEQGTDAGALACGHECEALIPRFTDVVDELQ
ncbi:hypothetical protein EYF80_041270 [Liparis tanakae]|uniref:Uncharacterized protein n=1 Tax=Liparis tanakae TaxID=230148 RepID=A0A4Z2G4M1_9TELE|nr:hypothetical protein EYF80_041270 [Liparis tanakae]